MECKYCYGNAGELKEVYFHNQKATPGGRYFANSCVIP